MRIRLGCALRARVVAAFLVGWCALIGAPVATAWAAGGASQPSHGTAPPTAAGRPSHQVIGGGKTAPAHKPAPALKPAHGTVITSPAPRGPSTKAEVGGVLRLGPQHPGAGRVIIPPPAAAHAPRTRNFTPSNFYSTTQLDNFSAL